MKGKMINNLKFRFVIAIVLVSLLFVSASPVTKLAGYPKHHFNAYIIQDGKQLNIDQHVVRVKRAPFQIILDMP